VLAVNEGVGLGVAGEAFLGVMARRRRAGGGVKEEEF
jgi:hypothetical protein